ncbi:MAG: hydroxyacylglutathione hydrolase [Pseudomonadota bacterium]
MALHITTIPCLSDNYAFLAVCSNTGVTALIDAPEAKPIKAELERQGLSVDVILLTHHHWDHIAGLDELNADADILGAQADVHRLPKLDRALEDGDTFKIGTSDVAVLNVSGHTIGHIAFHVPGSDAVFTGDSLMALGCGRLTEGTPEMMWESLQKLAALPPETRVYSGHEYTVSNGNFAKTVDPNNKALDARMNETLRLRGSNLPTVPSLLSLEYATNPFLRATSDDVKSHLGMQGASDVATFAEIRARKDAF